MKKFVKELGPKNAGLALFLALSFVFAVGASIVTISKHRSVAGYASHHKV